MLAPFSWLTKRLKPARCVEVPSSRTNLMRPLVPEGSDSAHVSKHQHVLRSEIWASRCLQDGDRRERPGRGCSRRWLAGTCWCPSRGRQIGCSNQSLRNSPLAIGYQAAANSGQRASALTRHGIGRNLSPSSDLREILLDDPTMSEEA
jgi:hypothetical protein